MELSWFVSAGMHIANTPEVKGQYVVSPKKSNESADWFFTPDGDRIPSSSKKESDTLTTGQAIDAAQAHYDSLVSSQTYSNSETA